MRSPVVPAGGIKDLAVLLAGFLEDMLWQDEAKGNQPPEPVQDMKDIVVALLLVCGGHDLANLGVDGRVIAIPPIEECVIVCSCGIEVLWAPHCHMCE